MLHLKSTAIYLAFIVVVLCCSTCNQSFLGSSRSIFLLSISSTSDWCSSGRDLLRCGAELLLASAGFRLLILPPSSELLLAGGVLLFCDIIFWVILASLLTSNRRLMHCGHDCHKNINSFDINVLF